jgi:hypothetical protein
MHVRLRTYDTVARESNAMQKWHNYEAPLCSQSLTKSLGTQSIITEFQYCCRKASFSTGPEILKMIPQSAASPQRATRNCTRFTTTQVPTKPTSTDRIWSRSSNHVYYYFNTALELSSSPVLQGAVWTWSFAWTSIRRGLVGHGGGVSGGQQWRTDSEPEIST